MQNREVCDNKLRIQFASPNNHIFNDKVSFTDINLSHSGLLRQPQLITVQRLVKCLYSALITNYCQLHDREYH